MSFWLAQDFLNSYDTKIENIDAADANLETIRGRLPHGICRPHVGHALGRVMHTL